MSSLGDLLLGKVSDRSPSPDADIKKDLAGYQNQKEHQQYHVGHRRDSSLSRDDEYTKEAAAGQQKTTSKRNEDDADERRSNASSTDDYVRELLDPNDRPRNVWHVVEGPKDSPDGSNSNDVNLNSKTTNSQSSPASHDECDLGVISNPNTQVKTERDEQMRAIISEAKSKPTERKDDDNIDETRSNFSPNNERKSVESNHHQVTAAETLVKDDGSVRDKDSQHRHRDKRSREHSDDRRHHRRDRHDIGPDASRADRHRDDRTHHKSDKYKSRKSKYDDYSDDDYDDYRSRKNRKRSRRSRSRSPASRTSSSRRRDRSKSDSRSPITKRDSRTILVMQLSPRVVSRDLEEFFSEIGRVREVRLIMDSKTRRHKGIAYIEFDDASTAGKALSLSGKKFHGVPMVIQSALSDRHSKSDYHSSSASNYNSHNHPTSSHSSSRSTLPPNSYRVYVGGLHVALTEDMLRSVFEPFGPIIKVELMKDRNTGISRGYAFLTYANVNDGQEAVRCLDGFELAGKNLRVSKSAEKSEH